MSQTGSLVTSHAPAHHQCAISIDFTDCYGGSESVYFLWIGVRFTLKQTDQELNNPRHLEARLL